MGRGLVGVAVVRLGVDRKDCVTVCQLSCLYAAGCHSVAVHYSAANLLSTSVCVCVRGRELVSKAACLPICGAGEQTHYCGGRSRRSLSGL